LHRTLALAQVPMQVPVEELGAVIPADGGVITIKAADGEGERLFPRLRRGSILWMACFTPW